jgi:hypothetical protein
MVAHNKNTSPRIHRALVFQGGGLLGAYEAGAYKDINEELSRFFKAILPFYGSLCLSFCKFISQSSPMLYLQCFTSGAKNIVEFFDIFELL